MAADSVSSMTSRPGGSPASSRAATTSGTTQPALKCWADRFTATLAAALVWCAQAAACRAAVVSAHRPSGTASPACSARGTKTEGGTSPSTGSVQRASASWWIRRPVVRS